VYRPGKAGGKPDALTWRSGDLPKEGDERLLANQQAVLKPHNVTGLALHVLENRLGLDQRLGLDDRIGLEDRIGLNDRLGPDNRLGLDDRLGPDNGLGLNDRLGPDNGLGPDDRLGPDNVLGLDNGLGLGLVLGKRPAIVDLLKEAYEADPLPNRILKLLREGSSHSREISLADCKVKDGRLIYCDCIYVPDHPPLRLRLLQDHHEPPAIGHPGRAKTLELLTRKYHWPQMRKDVDRFVRNCHTCRRTKATRYAPYGTLRPLPVPAQPWQHISVDFVTGLPPSKGYDAICVFVDRSSPPSSGNTFAPA